MRDPLPTRTSEAAAARAMDGDQEATPLNEGDGTSRDVGDDQQVESGPLEEQLVVDYESALSPIAALITKICTQVNNFSPFHVHSLPSPDFKFFLFIEKRKEKYLKKFVTRWFICGKRPFERRVTVGHKLLQMFPSTPFINRAKKKTKNKLVNDAW